MTDTWWIGKDLERRGRGLNGISLVGLNKSTETLFKLADVPAEVRTEHLQNTVLEHYLYAIPYGGTCTNFSFVYRPVNYTNANNTSRYISRLLPPSNYSSIWNLGRLQTEQTQFIFNCITSQTLYKLSKESEALPLQFNIRAHSYNAL
jgi:hypothetical protein